MAIVEVRNLNHIYGQGSVFEKKAIDDVNLNIDEGEFIAIIGHTGSGKSTFIQHLNGLLKATSGKILIDGMDITKKNVKLNDVRKKVGLVFQYPEYQLFEETIEKDVAFGPLNQGLKGEELDARVKDAIESVGLDYEYYKDKSPFELSGGQKRRVAIAGVLAMNPKILILDEPTAGLDPHGRDEIFDELRAIYEKKNITIILVSHSMEDVAKIADRLVVMKEGRIFMDGTPREVFKNEDELVEAGLGVPQITSFMRALRKKGADINDNCITIEEAKTEIERYLRSKKC